MYREKNTYHSLFVVIQTNELTMEICVVLKKIEKDLPQSQRFQKDSVSYNRITAHLYSFLLYLSYPENRNCLDVHIRMNGKMDNENVLHSHSGILFGYCKIKSEICSFIDGTINNHS